MSDRLKADLALVLVAAVWGGTFVMVKDALSAVGPLWFLALRFGIAALIMAPTLAHPRSRFDRTSVADGVMVGVLLFAGYAFQTAGLAHTTASRAGFITGLSVVLVPIGMALVFRWRPSRPAIIGAILAVAGLAMISITDKDLVGVGLGDLLVLLCAVAFAAHIVAVGAVATRVNTVVLTRAQILTAAGLSLVSALAFERLTLQGLLEALPAALFTAVFATVGAFYVQTRAQRFTSATHTALIFALEPVFSAAFAYALAGERLGPGEIVGCVLILVGMLVAQLERSEAARHVA